MKPVRSVIIFLLLLSFLFHLQTKGEKKAASPWSPDSSRKELIFLLEQRKKLFDEYSASLSKKSGLFGNQTKNDLRSSREKLEAIVAQDNRIMNALNRTLDFRNFEKMNLRFDAGTYEQRIEGLKILVDTLNTKVSYYEKDNKEMASALKRYQIYFVLLIAGMLVLAFLLMRKRSK